MRSLRYAKAALFLGFLASPVAAQDALTNGPTLSAPAAEYAARGGSITQNTSTTPAGGGVACAATAEGISYTATNYYARAFNLSTSGVTSPVVVESIDFGAASGYVEVFESFDTSMIIGRMNPGVNYAAGFGFDDFVQLDSTTFTVTNATTTGMYNVSFSRNVNFAPSDVLVVLWRTPDGTGNDPAEEELWAVRMGGNSAGESSPTYLAAPTCAITDLTPVTTVGTFNNSQWVVVVNTGAPSAAEAGPAGSRISLAAAAPNPIRGRATMSFSLEDDANVRASVYDVLGREVAVLADRAYGSGMHELNIDAAGLSAGTYVVRLATAQATVTRQIMVTR